MPTLTAVPADTAPPRVDVLFLAGELTSAATVTVFQISSMGRFPVRGGVRMAVTGGAFITDYEPPFGEVVTYQGEKFNAGGISLGLTGSASIAISLPEQMVIFQDPLAPKSWVMLTAEKEFASSVGRTRDISMYRRGAATVALMGELGLIENVSLRVVAYSAEDSQELADVLSVGYVLLRTAPAIPLPAAMHVVVPNPLMTPVGTAGVAVWGISGSQVSRSNLAIIESPVTYARFKAAFATYAAAKLVYSTYLQAKQSPPPEV